MMEKEIKEKKSNCSKIVIVILVIIFSTDFSANNTFSKLLYIGSIYALIKANSYTRQIIGGISTDISAGVSGLKNLKN